MFLVKVPNLEAYKRSVEYVGAVQWNSLSANTRNINSAASFKTNQKNCLLQKLV